MPALTTLAIAGLAIAAASSAYQIKSSVDQKNEAEDQAKQQKSQQDALIQQEKDQQAKTQGDMAANAARDQAAQRQRQVSASSQGTAGTILTGPGGQQQSALGTQNVGAAPAPAAGKTLLGT